VEDITSKTGNFKKFAVFVRMLHSAVLQQSDAVYVDLLTYQDLELLKSRKAAAAAGTAAAGATQQQRQLPANNKRYLILTYASEFDRVHYPLPLLHEGQPDPQRLCGVIQQLRQQLEDVLAGQQQQQQQKSRQHSTGQRSSQVGLMGWCRHGAAAYSIRRTLQRCKYRADCRCSCKERLVLCS
jgi:coiled-coil domain-containing protein 61